ncbi:MAG: hypothetical protein L3J61_06195, partial [Ghiorsea sp.]|nr:hypothetical protein [Ghiorsea sp.]
KNPNGSYSILSTSPTGQLRLITINPATGAVADTVTAGVPAGTAAVPAGTAGVTADGQFDDDGDDMDDMDDMDDSNDDSNDDHNDDDNDDDSNDDDDNTQKIACMTDVTTPLMMFGALFGLGLLMRRKS